MTISTQIVPEVSVIVPAYNYGHLIAETLESLLAQTFSGWECVIVDDGSTDKTREVVQKFADADARFHYIHQENSGLSASRNTGIRHARGRFIQFLDADDLLEKEKLACHVNYLQQNPDVDLVYSEVRYFRPGREDERTLSLDGGNYAWTVPLSGAGDEILRPLVHSNITAVHAPVLRREAVETVGFFDETLRAKEDWDFWLRLALAGKRFHFFEAPGTMALVRSHSISMTNDRTRMVLAGLRVREKLATSIMQPDILALNEVLAKREYALLGLEQALFERLWARKIVRLAKAGLSDGSPRFLLYALAFPVIKSAWFRPTARRLNALLSRLRHKAKRF